MDFCGPRTAFDGFKDIGAAHGPFDATMIQIGAYSEYWPDIHMTPEEGMRAHLDDFSRGCFHVCDFLDRHSCQDFCFRNVRRDHRELVRRQ